MLGNWEDKDTRAATFSGTKNGVQMCIRTLAPGALFVHCRAHVLQLCCVSAARCLPSLKNATLMSVWKMFQLAGTRQICKSNQVLHEATDRYTWATRILESQKHLVCWGLWRYNFVETLMMLSDVLPLLTCLSRALQAKTADLTIVASQLTYVQHSLQQIKEHPNDQEYLSTVHDTVTDLAIGVVDLETARENFNKNVLQQPYLDEVGRQISYRFKGTLGLLTAFSIFDPQKCPTDVQQLHKYGTAELEKLLKFYGETTEIEYEGNLFSTPADVERPRQDKSGKLSNWSSLRRRVCHWRNLQHCSWDVRQSVTFPNINILLSIAMVLPVSTATVERSFSDMKQIKDWLRNRLLPASMLKLMIIAIEGPPLHEVDFDAVLALWKAMKPQRLIWTEF